MGWRCLHHWKHDCCQILILRGDQDPKPLPPARLPELLLLVREVARGRFHRFEVDVVFRDEKHSRQSPLVTPNHTVHAYY